MSFAIEKRQPEECPDMWTGWFELGSGIHPYLKFDVMYCHSPAGAIRSVIAVMMICSLSPLSFMPSSLQQDPENRSSESTGNFIRFQMAIKVLTYMSIYQSIYIHVDVYDSWILNNWLTATSDKTISSWQLNLHMSTPGAVDTCVTGQMTSDDRKLQMNARTPWTLL